ncbi:MAG: tRNA pseudouridine(55) synthase TruB [Candidatus Nanopelagicaceae bacterium]|nr:tRNA pseudouridine(55) synthase TruB [Candidatus Nanopelagicaceae bacterium]
MKVSHGFVIVDKPAGITSHDVVGKLRKTLGTKRVGHAGTLDPMATGVLVLGINNATKFLQYVTEGKKQYLATIRLGQATTTDDKEGEILSTSDTDSITDQQIKDLLAKQVGIIMQTPSQVSAIKIDGERAYDLVRQGKAVEIPAREIEIFQLLVNEIRRGEFLDIDIDVICSAGTYIRSIARDLGAALGVGGHLISLRRTLVAPFNLSDCSTLETPEIRPLAEAISQVMPIRQIDVAELAELRFGRALTKSVFSGVGVAIAPDGEVAAIIENRDYGAQPISVFVS